MDLGLEDKVAIVGGASKGIGRACAVVLGQEKAKLALCSRNGEVLEQTAQDIREATSAEVLTIPGDLYEYETVKKLVSQAADRFGRIDILVNNTGGPPPGRAQDTDEEAWSIGIQGTLLYFVRMCREALPYLRRQGGGRIINILSTTVKQPIENLVLSNSLRMGVVGFTKNLADEVAKDNILINNVCPGSILTDRLRSLVANNAKASGRTVEELLEEDAARIPIGRIGQPEELANLVAFLASERASYITGTTIQVDGGSLRAVY